MSERVLIDGRCLQTGGSRVRGIGAYLRGLLAGLVELEGAPAIDLLLSRRLALPGEVAERGLGSVAAVAGVPHRLRLLADPLVVAAALRRHPGYAVYHGIEYGQPLVSRVATVITVHDLIPLLFPNLYPRWRRPGLRTAVGLLRRAEAVIVPSRRTAGDVVEIARVDAGKIDVIPHGVDAAFRPSTEAAITAVRHRHGLDGPFLLSVGAFDPTKRRDLLFGVAARVSQQRGAHLAVAGAQGRYEPAARAAVAAAGLDGRVHLLGHVGQADLVALYAAAESLVVTSAYEGFGFPILEAMACGTPVVAFANSAIPETAGDAALLVDDGDAGAMAAALCRVLDDATVRRRLIAAGLEHAGGFTWARAAAQTLAVYRRIAGR